MKKLLLIVSIAIFSNFLYSQNCIVDDRPDKLFQDINFDGIDGDITKAVFVSTTDGNDLNDGTFSNPVKTIEKGIEIATVEEKDVYVAMGNYYLTETLEPSSGVSIYGKFNGLPNWQRSNDNETVIFGPETAILFQNISEITYIEGLSIYSADATTPGESSYAIKLIDCSELVSIKHNFISSGSGSNGTNGANGMNGLPGAPGSPGTNGTCDGSPNGTGGAGGSSPCGNTGGAGGNGGLVGPNNGTAGAVGGGGTPAGDGGNYGDPGQAGQNGQTGSAGMNGSNGSQAVSQVNINSLGLFISSDGNNGSDGSNGNGGGGGGGGGAQNCVICGAGSGNGGSGGGGGGCAGIGGLAGTGGSSSFGIIAINSMTLIEQNTIITSTGGNGGDGGDAGEGGNGGNGASIINFCTGEIGAGGSGGNGGNGGNGGAASGAQGGHSIGIFIATNSVAKIADNDFTIADPGMGGIGGQVPDMGMSAPNGPIGIAEEIYGVFTSPETISPDLCSDNTSADEPIPTEQNFAVFSIILNEPTSQSASVDYQTVSGSAVEGINFISASGTISFDPYEMIKTVEIEVLNDSQIVENLQFSVQFSNPVNTALVNSESICTINDNGISSVLQSENFGFRVFPNPASDYFQINLNDEDYRYTITNTAGKKIISGAGHSESVIDISRLDSGIYFVSIESNGISAIRKLTIVK